MDFRGPLHLSDLGRRRGGVRTGEKGERKGMGKRTKRRGGEGR